ncbi:MAG TPA: hypothetical protein VGF03_09690 [Bryobacteraceae bacterium]
MLRPSYVFLAVWGIAVLVLWFTIGAPEPAQPEEWAAARMLPRNAQIREIDLHGPEQRYRQARMTPKAKLVGQYLAVAKQAGEPIRKEDVQPEPLLPPCERGSGVLVYSLKGEEPVAEALQVGSWVIPCYIRPGASGAAAPFTLCAKTSVAVEVVHRSTGAADSPWVGLRVPSCRLQEIGEFVMRDKHFLLTAAVAAPVQNQACAAR